jgi:hypothetical protein
MAEPSIVQGLFGATPEAYQQQQQRQAMQDALAMAQLDPMQLARANIMAGANRAAGGIAGLMGVEDPQMRLISQRNALAKQIDMNDPESIMRGAQMAAQMGDTVAAGQLADYARKAASELSLIQQRNRERQAADPMQQLIRSGKYTPASIATYAKSGNVADLESIEKPGKEPTPLDIQRAQLYRQQLIDQKAPASQIAEVDAYIKGLITGKGTVVQNIIPGPKEFIDIPKFRSTVQNTIKPQLDVIDATDNALEAIKDSITNNNPISFNAAKVQLAKSLGDSQLSRRDVEAAGGDPSIYGKLIDTTSEFFTSTPSIDTQKKIQSTLNVVRNLNAKKASNEIDAQRKIAARLKYDPEAVAEALDFPQLKEKQKGFRVITLKSGKTVTVLEE